MLLHIHVVLTSPSYPKICSHTWELQKDECLRKYILIFLKLDNMSQDDINAMCGGAKNVALTVKVQ